MIYTPERSRRCLKTKCERWNTDAEKHLQKLRERRDTAIMWELNCNDEATKDRAQEAILIFNECIAELIDEPTADVRENVRGYWKKRKDKPLQNWYQCSNCGAICGETPKYCSECGAQMIGDNDV